MKNERQTQLLQIISEESIETQEQLLERLQARGIKSTQATISRDIKQLPPRQGAHGSRPLPLRRVGAQDEAQL